MTKNTHNKNLVARWFRPLALIMVLVAVSAVSAAAASHPLKIAGAEKTRVGIYIEDLRTGEVLADINADEYFTPASVMKSVTAATALSELMPSGRFTTPVQAQGKIKDGRLEGNIVVQVVGDPTIESRHFAANLGFADSIAAGLKRLGIREITGAVVIDESLFADPSVPDGWEKGDLNYAYGTVLRGANYRGNSSGNKAVTNPAGQMRESVSKAIRDAGIELGTNRLSTTTTDVATVYVHTSPTVYDILHSLMIRSDNLFAEGMLRALDPYNPRSSAIDYEISVWRDRGLNFNGISINDGSGLSRYDRVTPRFMASLYRWMYNDPMQREYSDLFPRAGQEGTMRNFLKDTRLTGRLAMKTGSMSGVQGYGGYLLDEEGTPTHAVVIFVNNFTCGRDALKREIADFLLEKLP